MRRWKRVRRLAVAALGALLLPACTFGSGAARPPKSPPPKPGPAPADPGPATPAAMDVVSTQPLKLRETPPARPPAGDVQDVAFLDGRHGLLVSAGVRMAGPNGVTLDRPGRIQTTTDGGKIWRTVWRGPDTSLSWVGWSGADVAMAAGLQYTAGGSPSGTPVLLHTADGGRTWTEVWVRLP